MARSSTSFKPGNTAALRHGGRSPRTIQKAAAEVRESLAALLGDKLPSLAEADQPLLDLAIDVTAQLTLIRAYLDRTSGGLLIDGRGRPRSCSRLYLSLMRQAVSIYDRLGCGPLARSTVLANLGSVRGDSLGAQLARQRAELEAQGKLYAPIENANEEEEKPDAEAS